MRNDYTGVPHTCPKIDEIMSLVDELHSCACDFEYSEDARRLLDQINAGLEEVRAANLHLREFGNEKAKEVYELENELEVNQREISSLTHEICILNSTIGDLEDKLADVKYG